MHRNTRERSETNVQSRNEAWKAQFEEKGYIQLPNLFTEQETERFKLEIQRVLDVEEAKYREEVGNPEAVPIFRKNGVYVGLAVASPVFREAAAHPALAEALSQVIGPQVDFLSDKIVFKNADTDFGSPWHQDYAYWEGAHKYSVWIALDDATPENGCLKVVDGSHRLGYIKHGYKGGIGFQNQLGDDVIDETKIAVLPAKRGDAIVFHDLLFHASYPNESGADRWALISTYRNAAVEDMPYSWAKAAFRVVG